MKNDEEANRNDAATDNNGGRDLRAPLPRLPHASLFYVG